MVYCEIRDGLGNQLFQYAAGRALANRLGTSLRLETRYYDKHRTRPFLLRDFHIRASFATRGEELVVRRWNKQPYARATALLTKGVPRLALTVFHDPMRHYDERISSAKGNVYLSGYWQSERYFNDFSVEIRSDITLKNEPDAANRTLLDEIAGSNSVSIHVRRGDYVAVTSFAERFGTCSLDYYERSIQEMKNRVADPHFFVFSDEPEWARENIKPSAKTTYVSQNMANSPVEDLRLMSHCKHFIIANSSFSWWGAWLSRSDTKLIIAPKRWFAGYETPHVVPDGWLRI